MVFDATAKAFNLSESTDDYSPHASTSATVSTTLPNTATRPAKRRRITQSGTMLPTPTPSPAPTPIVDLDALDAARRRAAGRVMSLWESLAEKYARPIEEDDEIDILTGKICRDRGVLRSVSERGWKIGSFGEALEVEPLVMVSEGETETGASEADDEGEGEDDTEGEGAEGTEAGEEDPLGGWSYDWQYRVLPPPRPELSPQDAEDLKEFLAAESAIKESLRKNGKEPEPEDDDIVYLGDSLHNIDGTLRIDESSDDEFASMAITDSSTIRYMKHEDDEDEDDIEPMASILGALALGRTPKKQLPLPSRPSPKDEEMDNKDSPLSGSPRTNATGGNYPDSGPPASPIRPPTGAPTPSGVSGLDVDDDLIVIDSDTDDELEPIDDSVLKSGILPSSPSKSIVPSASASTSNAHTQQGSSGIPATNSASVSSNHTRSLVTQSIRIPKVSIAGVTAPLEPPAAQQSPSNGERAPSLLPGSPVPSPAAKKNCAPKRAPRESAPKPQALGSRTVTINGHPRDDALDARSVAATASTPAKKGFKRVPETSPRVKPPNQRVHKMESPVKATRCKTSKSGAGAGAEGKPALTQGVTARPGSPLIMDISSPEVPILAPTASPSSLSQPKSPVKRRRKATVVEVVLPVSKKVLKVKRESTAPLPPATPKDTALTKAAAAPNEQPYPQSGESAPSSELPNSTSKTTHPIPHTSLVVRSGVELGLKRKRSLNGPELAEGAGNASESRTNAGSVGLGPGPLQPCCPPTQLGPNQPVACCSAHPQYHTAPHSHAHTSHSAHPSCSTHHHLGIPVYQHQHQHQHLHTHLPYPLPQLPYTANELTEAAFKLIHGLSTFHQASGAGGSSGTSFWFSGAQLPFGLAIPGQVGSSSQTSAPKLEEPSSQERISNESIPSSQEHERKAEARNNPPDEKPNQILPPLPRLEDPAPAAFDPLFEVQTENKTNVTPVVSLSSSSNSKLPLFEREMSVIDIESDSDDELAVCDAGAGSMRWEPPVKKEADTDVEEGSKRQPSPSKCSINSRMSSRTSPVKLKRMT